MGSAGLALIDIINDMLHNLDEGEYDGCNGPWDREMLFDIEWHPRFEELKDYRKTPDEYINGPDEYITSIDILNLVKYVDGRRRDARDEMVKNFEKENPIQ